MIYTLLLTANGSAWAWAWTAFAERPALLGTALLAYLFGLRHAFDADHIAAIDNVVRKLTQEGKASLLWPGFFFSLGHSTGRLCCLRCHRRNRSGHAAPTAMPCMTWGASVGTAVSAPFLLLAIGVANLSCPDGVSGPPFQTCAPAAKDQR